MSKREVIDQILRVNRSAQANFLASFDRDELLVYLHQLQEVERDRSSRQIRTHDESFVFVMA